MLLVENSPRFERTEKGNLLIRLNFNFELRLYISKLKDIHGGGLEIKSSFLYAPLIDFYGVICLFTFCPTEVGR